MSNLHIEPKLCHCIADERLGYFDVDAAFSRTFKLGERFSLDTRIEGFDVTNHPNFGEPTPSQELD